MNISLVEWLSLIFELKKSKRLPTHALLVDENQRMEENDSNIYVQKAPFHRSCPNSSPFHMNNKSTEEYHSNKPCAS